MEKTFEEYLQSKHAENYIGTDDDMPESYENWISNFDYEDWIRHADEYAELKLVKAWSSIINKDEIKYA